MVRAGETDFQDGSGSRFRKSEDRGMGSDPQSYLQYQHDRQFGEVRKYLMALRDGIDTDELHCEPVPIESSWRYMVDKALEAIK